MSIKAVATIAMFGMCFAGSAQAEGLFSTSKGGMLDQGISSETKLLEVRMPEKYRTGFAQNGGIVVSAEITPHSDDELDVPRTVDGKLQAAIAEWVERGGGFSSITATVKAGAYLDVEGAASLKATGAVGVMDGWSLEAETDPNLATEITKNHRLIPSTESYGVQVVDGRPIFDMHASDVKVADGRPIFEAYDMMMGNPAAISVSFHSGS